jgi:hypothetical protein
VNFHQNVVKKYQSRSSRGNRRRGLSERLNETLPSDMCAWLDPVRRGSAAPPQTLARCEAIATMVDVQGPTIIYLPALNHFSVLETSPQRFIAASAS